MLAEAHSALLTYVTALNATTQTHQLTNVVINNCLNMVMETSSFVFGLKKKPKQKQIDFLKFVK